MCLRNGAIFAFWITTNIQPLHYGVYFIFYPPRQISKGSVICLQEVGIQWAGDLHVYFMAKGYSFVTAHYGKAFNNYMGESQKGNARCCCRRCCACLVCAFEERQRGKRRGWPGRLTVHDAHGSFQLDDQ